MSQSRSSESASSAFEPDATLVQNFARKFRFDADKVAAILSRFGALPEGGQLELLEKLAKAWGLYQRLGNNVDTIAPNIKRDQLESIEGNSERLLYALGINPNNIDVNELLEPFSETPASRRLQLFGKQSPNGIVACMALASATIDFSDRETSEGLAQINSELRNSGEHLSEVVIGLLWLHAKAKAAAESARLGVLAGHGGARNRPAQVGQLISDAIEIHKWGLSRISKNGNKSQPGMQLQKFVRAVTSLFGVEVSDQQMKDGLRQWNSNRTKS